MLATETEIVSINSHEKRLIIASRIEQAVFEWAERCNILEKSLLKTCCLHGKPPPGATNTNQQKGPLLQSPTSFRIPEAV